MYKSWLKLTVAVAGLICSGGAFAADSAATNAIEKVHVGTESNVLVVRVDLASEAPIKPGSWSVVEPPRIVLDFPATENRTGKSASTVALADLKSYNIVQTEQMTRLVLNLYRTSQYTVETQGKAVFVRIDKRALADAGPSGASQRNEMMPGKTPGSAVLADPVSTIRDIGFRRGEEGQALITVDLSDGSVPVDVRRDGDMLKVEVRGTELPDRLRQRRDVNDFATPVTAVTSQAVGNITRVDVSARGAWFHQTNMSGNQLTVEVKQIPQSDLNKLVQAGQQGQKVSINFFDAESTMILRTLAEISGKNVMIDPSLAGRRVTVMLDNIPYDQALDIVMAQASAGMRVRGEIILFGDRAVLQRRDQETADELTRANETAPIVSETFTLSYIKPSEMVALIRANIAAPAAQGGAAAAAAAAPGAAPAAGAAAAPAGGGMLSNRGVMSPHDPTKKLFIRDTAAVIEAVREIIRNVDVPQKQVMIEARIVEASTGFTNSLGLRMRLFQADQLGRRDAGYGIGSSDSARFAFGTTAGLTNTDSFGGTTTPTLARSTEVFNPGYALRSATNFGLMLFNSAATRLLSLELAAAENDLKNKTVSAPKVLTMDRKPATINNTQQVTILTGVNATTGLPIFQTFSAPLNLTVTPSINPDNRISLELNIAKSTITNATTGSLDTNTVTTAVIVENGGTVAIGGFTREGENVSQDRVPFFGDLPYVGFLFKSTQTTKNRSELLVFITPKIVGDDKI